MAMGDAQIRVGILDDDIAHAGQRNVQLAALVVATAGAIDVAEAKHNLADLVTRPVQAEAQASFGMRPQASAQFDAMSANFHFHCGLLSIVSDDGFKIRLVTVMKKENPSDQ